MKKIFILAIVFIGLFTSSATVEQRTTMDILTSYKWCMNENALAAERNSTEPYTSQMYLIFTDSLFTICEIWSDGEIDYTINRYYLETQYDEKERKFITSKVGKNKNGNYIFEESEEPVNVDVLRIVELTEKKLVVIPMGSIGEQTVWEARLKD